VKILIIGSGFIATPIIHRLESEGHDLLVYSRTLNQRIQSQQILGDILQFDDFIKTLAWEPQILINTAWITTHGLYKSDSMNYRYAKFAFDLARHISRTNIEHLIVLGTCAEYGNQIGASTAGVTQVSPNSLYAEQKVAAFYAVRGLLEDTPVRMTWARIFQPYGPMQDVNCLIPYLIRSLKNGDRVRLNDTSSINDWITTRDIASAISWVINHHLPAEIDIGTTFGFTNVEILRHLEELSGSTNQWMQFVSRTRDVNKVCVVGKDSPLFTSGWIPNDSLNSGLKWVLTS
jgi:nucleoside-diphosphate-sugar epimerase